MLYGPDLSNYQGQLTAAHARALREAGCSFAIIGRQWRNTFAPLQREHLRAAGIVNIAEYLININGQWPELWPETRYVAVDVEPGSEFVTEDAIDGAIGWIESQGRIPIVYSSSWAWSACGLDAVTKYGERGVLLWNANYDRVANGYALPYPFGGWMTCVIDQYTDAWRDVPDKIPFDLDMNTCEESLWEVASQAPSQIEPAPVQVPPVLTRDELVDVFVTLGYGINAVPVSVNYEWGSRVYLPDGRQVHTILVSGRQ